MPEEVLFKTEEERPRAQIAEILRNVAAQIDDGSVHLEGRTGVRDVAIPDTPLFEVELERLTDSETGEERYELEYEIRWTE